MTEQKKLIVPDEEEKIIQIELERLTTFKNHPFKVKEDSEMKMLMESIEKYRILNPLIVRPLKEGVYEIVSGHRRKYAAEKLGYRKVPVIIRVMADEESVIAMVDANLQRESMEIEISQIHSFEDHPFKVMDDEKMDELVESIRANGVLVPVLLRPDERNGYEMVSGHRRMHASKIAGLTTIPAIVREMSRDDAVIAMVDANIQREELLPSEKAFAYKMKKEALSHQGERNDLTLGQNVPKFKRTTEEIAEGTGESYKQVQRYIRLTELIPDLLEMVDAKKLNFTTAVDISYIDKQVQTWLYEYICDNGFIKPNQITELRKYLGQGNMTQPLMISVLNIQ